MLPTNQTRWDRLLRLLLAVAMGLGGVSGQVPSPWELALILFAFYPLVTGILGWDPLYVLLGYGGTSKSPRR